jgi:hypothetical protein
VVAAPGAAAAWRWGLPGKPALAIQVAHSALGRLCLEYLKNTICKNLQI